MPNKSQLTQLIKEQTIAAGFHKVGIAAAKSLEKSTYLEKWLKLNRHGAMSWMANNLDKRKDVTKLYPDAQSVISVGHNYYTRHRHSNDPAKGKISRYAWGKDYHKIIKKKLKNLFKEIQKMDPTIEGRIFVDTAPIQDKLWAEAGGIGWQGKNTNIITRDMGSWIFLGEIIINKELEYDQPAIDYCGDCSACIDACPTKALEPYKLDATKCLSYLTIEYWDQPIPEKYAVKMHNWIFGCDICQDVCPWNKFAVETDEEAYQPGEGNAAPDLDELNQLSEDQFKKRFGKSPVYRAKYKNFMRNVRTVIKNINPD
ncbi:MAG: tRNA epoxyqueuosine(34) reductase QueG [Calditrichaceae bacterium]|nr:tRNA epoxyqueuosine(34) reductase QueG [Calditrichaceae bacterium]